MVLLCQWVSLYRIRKSVQTLLGHEHPLLKIVNPWKVVPIYKKIVSTANRKPGWKYYAYIAFTILTNIIVTVTLIIIINF